MAADMFRIVYTRASSDGVERTVASEPVIRDEAMRRFSGCVTLRMHRVRVIREQDYQPALFGPQQRVGVHRVEVA